MKKQPKLAALILAAGSSARMGTLKALLPLGQSTLLEQTVQRFLAAGIEDVRVVVGHKAEEIISVLARSNVEWILNSNYGRGMLSSILAGVEGLDETVEAFFVIPADIPLVKPETIRTLTEGFQKNRPMVVYPCIQGRRGHPPLISLACMAEKPSWDYPGGLRTFLSRFEEYAVEADVIDEGILMDCDTPLDYQRIRKRFLTRNIPTQMECRAIWDTHKVPEATVAHCRTVAELARALAVELNRAGFHIDLDLVTAAGFLHDLAKGQPNHAKVAAELLRKLGYARTGKVVKCHMDLLQPSKPPGETELIYLADKLVKGSNLVSLEERFKTARERFGADPEVSRIVEKRFKYAETIKHDIEKVLQKPLECIIQKYENSIRAASMQDQRKIFLVRHGEIQIEGNGKRYIGQMDLPLSERGIVQAQNLREKLGQADITAVFSSDLRRSFETAQIIAEPHRIEVESRVELREIALGEWEGLPFTEIQQRFPDEFEKRGSDIVHYRPPGGESFLDCAFRIAAAFLEILWATTGNILIAGHAGVNRILLCEALGKSLWELFEIRQDYGCLNVLSYDESVLRADRLNLKVGQ